jgi:hypothetical protein
MDGVLLEVRNQEERCYAWILDAATSHIWTWRLSIFPSPNRSNHYIDRHMFRLHDVAMPVYTQLQPSVFLPLITIMIHPWEFTMDSSLAPSHHGC